MEMVEKQGVLRDSPSVPQGHPDLSPERTQGYQDDETAGPARAGPAVPDHDGNVVPYFLMTSAFVPKPVRGPLLSCSSTRSVFAIEKPVW